MASNTVEKCANCGSVIGNLEMPCVHQEHVVCQQCKKILQATPERNMSYLMERRGHATSSAVNATISDQSIKNNNEVNKCEHCGMTFRDGEDTRLFKGRVVCVPCDRIACERDSLGLGFIKSGYAHQRNVSGEKGPQEWLFRSSKASVSSSEIRIAGATVRPSEVLYIELRQFRRSFTIRQVYRVDLHLPFDRYCRADFSDLESATRFARAVSLVSDAPIREYQPPPVFFFFPLN